MLFQVYVANWIFEKLPFCFEFKYSIKNIHGHVCWCTPAALAPEVQVDLWGQSHPGLHSELHPDQPELQKNLGLHFFFLYKTEKDIIILSFPIIPSLQH